jgi:hypothetical protein
MLSFMMKGASTQELLALNRCCLFLYAYNLSDILSGDGSSISDYAWMGMGQRNHP